MRRGVNCTEASEGNNFAVITVLIIRDIIGHYILLVGNLDGNIQ